MRDKTTARKKLNAGAIDPLAERLAQRVIGQQTAVEAIASYVRLFEAGLAPENRPAGVFLLLGPTGTGKTRTVEALAETLHGNDQHFVRIDCGEFQLDHETAKLIGAPPGYLGHRETHPLLTQQKINAAASERSSLSIVLFDEIEKAAPSMQRLLLGVLDKARLKLGDNTTVNFQNCLIFMTSNLGSAGMMEQLTPSFGFAQKPSQSESDGKMERIAMNAVRRFFSPEFVNRIDQTITYRALSKEDIIRILDIQIAAVQQHLHRRLGPRSFRLSFTPESRKFLVQHGISTEYGARELKRTIHRHLLQPLAHLIADGYIRPGCELQVRRDGDQLCFAQR